MLIVASCRLLRGEEDAVSTNLRLCVHTQTRKLWLCGTESEESLSPSVGKVIVRKELLCVPSESPTLYPQGYLEYPELALSSLNGLFGHMVCLDHSQNGDV